MPSWNAEIALRTRLCNWVVNTAKDWLRIYVRDNNKLGVVITPQVRPNEAKPSEVFGPRLSQNFPNQDLTVLMYAPDKS